MMGTEPDDIGVGATDELSLRVSAAALARVVFTHPQDGTRMLALEHKASVVPASQPPMLTVRAQPFGGAVRLRRIEGFQAVAEDFRFDSQRSRDEQDLRVFVRPSRLAAVHDFCFSHAPGRAGSDLETDPSRELWEEFEDTVGVEVDPSMYTMSHEGIVLENVPSPTNNVRAPGKLTARIYWVYNVELTNAELCSALLASSRAWGVGALGQMAMEAYGKGNPGWANAALVLPLESVRDAYLAVAPNLRGRPMTFQGASLAGNVAAVLDGVDVPKYERYI